jgi:hypothetical protein
MLRICDINALAVYLHIFGKQFNPIVLPLGSVVHHPHVPEMISSN